MKNFKLLLATTALLSTVSAYSYAGLNVAPDKLQSTFDASISILIPETITGGYINFPSIITAGGRIIKVNADGTVDETVTTAQTLGGSAVIGAIHISGGNYGSLKSDSAHDYEVFYDENSTQQERDAALANVATRLSEFGGATISIPDIPLFDESDGNSGQCGSVKDFTLGQAVFMTLDGVDGVGLYYGATFEMKEGFIPNNGYADCTGSAIVTYIPYDW